MHSSVQDWILDSLAQPHLTSPNETERESLHHTIPSASSSRTTTAATSAALTDYRNNVLGDTCHAYFRLEDEFADQLPRTLAAAAALGSVRDVPFIADAAAPASAQQGTSPPSAVTLAEDIRWRIAGNRSANLHLHGLCSVSPQVGKGGLSPAN